MEGVLFRIRGEQKKQSLLKESVHLEGVMEMGSLWLQSSGMEFLTPSVF